MLLEPINSAELKCTIVRDLINDYLLKHPKLTLQNVENKTNTPYSTLRRIITLTGNPDPETVIKIFMGLGKDLELINYMKQFHPQIAKAMAIGQKSKSNHEYLTPDELQLFSEEKYFLILNLAFTIFGTTEEEVFSALGENGILALNELVHLKVLIKQNNGRCLGRIQEFQQPISDVKQNIEFALKHYLIEEAGGINNFMGYQVESLNIYGLIALKALNQKQAIERRVVIFSNPSFVGPVKVFNANISSTFISSPEFKKEEHIKLLSEFNSNDFPSENKEEKKAFFAKLIKEFNMKLMTICLFFLFAGQSAHAEIKSVTLLNSEIIKKEDIQEIEIDQTNLKIINI